MANLYGDLTNATKSVHKGIKTQGRKQGYERIWRGDFFWRTFMVNLNGTQSVHKGIKTQGRKQGYEAGLP